MLNYEELISEKLATIEDLEEQLEHELADDEKSYIRTCIEVEEEELASLREEAKEMAYCRGDMNRLLGLRNSDFY
jgi:DNA repair exonuclease SbcCD ATPase subunit